jgi:hypothetical protein
MTSENDLPALVRFEGLYERGIVDSYQASNKNRGLSARHTFGSELASWGVDEVNAGLASRPSEPSRRTKDGAAKSVETRRLRSAREMIDRGCRMRAAIIEQITVSSL